MRRAVQKTETVKSLEAVAASNLVKLCVPRSIVVFSSLTLCLLAMSPVLAAGSVVDVGDAFRETTTVANGDWRAYRIALSSLDSVAITVQVTQGGRVDVYTTNEFGFGEYTDPNATTFGFYAAGSMENKTSFRGSFTPPTSGRYYVIVDNARIPIGGATPTGPVTVDVQFEKRSLVPIVGGILGAIVGVALLLVWAARRRRRRTAVVREKVSPPPPIS